MIEPIKMEDSDDKKILLDQYKILVDTLNKTNDLREKSNDFWVSINTGLLGVFSYFRDQFLLNVHHNLFLWTLLIIGFILCCTWLNTLIIVKKRIDMLNTMIIEMERHLPAKLFTIFILKMGRIKGKGSLTLKESIVPILFIIGYNVGAFILYFQPNLYFKT